jgi:hypothetical protein
VLFQSVAEHPQLGPAFRAYIYMAYEFFHAPLPMNYKQDQYAEKHYQNLLATYCGRGKQKKFFRLLIENIQRAFSKEQLNDIYPDNNGNYYCLRAKYLWVLIGRFRRSDAWRAKFKNLDPF